MGMIIIRLNGATCSGLCDILWAADGGNRSAVPWALWREPCPVHVPSFSGLDELNAIYQFRHPRRLHHFLFCWLTLALYSCCRMTRLRNARCDTIFRLRSLCVQSHTCSHTLVLRKQQVPLWHSQIPRAVASRIHGFMEVLWRPRLPEWKDISRAASEVWRCRAYRT